MACRGLAVAASIFGLLCGSHLLAQSSDPHSRVLDGLVEWIDPLEFQETPAVPFIDPRVAIDGDTGYLIVDAPASQVRVYGQDGRLVTYFGREGDGPGEFRDLRGVARLPSGNLVTVDFTGRVAEWTANGGLLRDHRPSLAGPMGVSPISDTLVAIVTAPMYEATGSDEFPWVRLFDLSRSELGAQLLTLRSASLSRTRSMQGEYNPTLGRRFALTWGVLDSLWIVQLDPPSVRRMALDSDLVRANRPVVDRPSDTVGFREWMTSSTFANAAFSSPNGGWLVSLWRPRLGGETHWGLLRLDENGRRVWEVHPTPRLMAVDPHSGVLIFVESSGVLPNRFDRARLRK